MANHVEPGIVGGATQQTGDRTGTAQPVRTAGYAAPDPDASDAAAPGARPPYVGQAPGSPVAPYISFHGRPVSWVAVATIMVGFLVGGLALAFDTHGPIWWLFWLGVGLAAIGGLLALATGIFDDWY